MVLPANAIVIYNDSPWKDWPCKIQAVQGLETIVQWAFEKTVIEKKLPAQHTVIKSKAIRLATENELEELLSKHRKNKRHFSLAAALEELQRLNSHPPPESIGLREPGVEVPIESSFSSLPSPSELPGVSSAKVSISAKAVPPNPSAVAVAASAEKPHESDSEVCSSGEVAVADLAARKVPARKVPARKVPARKVPARKVPARKVPARKVPAKKVAARKVAADPLPSNAVDGVPASPSPASPLPPASDDKYADVDESVERFFDRKLQEWGKLEKFRVYRTQRGQHTSKACRKFLLEVYDCIRVLTYRNAKISGKTVQAYMGRKAPFFSKVRRYLQGDPSGRMKRVDAGMRAGGRETNEDESETEPESEDAT